MHELFKLGPINGLHHVLIDLILLALALVNGARRFPRKRHYVALWLDLVLGLYLSDAFARFKTIHLWHLDVHEDQLHIPHVLGVQIEGLSAIMRDQDVKLVDCLHLVSLKHGYEELNEVFLVICNYHF